MKALVPPMPGLEAGTGVPQDEAFAWLDRLTDTVLHVDGDFRIRYANRSLFDLAGLPHEEFIGRGLFDVFPGAVGTAFEKAARQAVATGSPQTCEAYYDPWEAWLEMRAFPSDGGLVIFSRDVSERHRLLAELEARTRQQAAVAELGQRALAGPPLQELLDVIAAVLSRELEYEATAVLQWLPAEPSMLLRAGTGWRPGIVGVGRLRATRDSPAGLAVQTGEPVVVEDIHSDPRFVASPVTAEHGLRRGIIVPVRPAGGVWGAVAVMTKGLRATTPADVHFVQAVAHLAATAIERDERESDLRRHRDQLELLVEERTRSLTDSMRELESFSYTVSHDLRTPLRTVGGFGDLLEIRYGESLPAEGRELLRKVRSGAQQMAHLVDDLLTLSRVGQGELVREPVDLSAVATGILERLAARTPSRPLRFHVEPGLVADAYPVLVRTLLENLISNACKFTAPRPQAEVWVGRSPEGAFYVRDNGVGFPAEHAAKLFVPFNRLHGSEFEGTGVGLATVARIATRHGGRVGAESQDGQGATFWFTLGP